MGGEWAKKSDQGGHSNWQHDNLNVYASGPAVDLFNVQRPGFEDRYFNNTVVQLSGTYCERGRGSCMWTHVPAQLKWRAFCRWLEREDTVDFDSCIRSILKHMSWG